MSANEQIRFNQAYSQAILEWQNMSLDEQVNALWQDAEGMVQVIQDCMAAALRPEGTEGYTPEEYDPNDAPMWRRLAAWINWLGQEFWVPRRAEDTTDDGYPDRWNKDDD